MYLEGLCPVPWRWRRPLERWAMALPLPEESFSRLSGVPGPAPLTIAAAGDLSMERMPSDDPADWCDQYRPPQDEPVTARPATIPDEDTVLRSVRDLRARAGSLDAFRNP